MAASKEQLRSAYEDCKLLSKCASCTPILIRLAWHDSGNYDVHTNTGGAKGTIRFDKELGHGANAGLENALGLLKPIKEKYPDISWADLIQMASAAGIEAAGGPKIPLRFGRRDAESDSEVPVEGRLPEGDPPYHQADGETPLHAATDNQDHAAHIRRVFYRMGLNDKDIVALSGGHTVGRAHSNRSGANRKEATLYTENGPGTKGGQSWTENWLEFDNRYFTMLKDESEGKTNDDLLKLCTDYVLITDPDFKPYTEAYAADKDKFFEDYKESHKKLSELGSITNGGWVELEA